MFNSINSQFDIPKYDIENEPIKEMILLEPFAKGKDGKIVNDSKYFRVVESGSTYDFQAKIESYREDCEIYSILKRVLASGDNSLLYRDDSKRCDVYDIDCKSNLDLYNLSKDNISKINNAISKLSGEASSNSIRSEDSGSVEAPEIASKSDEVSEVK